MTKRILALILTTLMLLAGAALAELPAPLFEADSLSNSGAEASGAFVFTKDRLDGLVDREGNVLAEAQFGKLSHAGENCYEATNESGFNHSALINTTGEVLTPYEYSDFDVISPNWAVGVVLEGTNDKDGADYNVIFGEYDYATIVRNDVFYLPEKKLVGSLDRTQYSRGREAGIGGYLIVEDKNGDIAVYDTALTAVDTPTGT